MQSLLAIFLCLATISPALASDGGYKLTYEGGTIPKIKRGDHVKLYFDENQIRVVKNKADLLVLPAAAITEISHDQEGHQHSGTEIAAMTALTGVGGFILMSKSKKHFVGITWNNGTRGGAMFQADKNESRGVLVGLEAVTGKTINSAGSSVRNREWQTGKIVDSNMIHRSVELGSHTSGTINSDYEGGSTVSLNTRIEQMNIKETELVIVGQEYAYVVERESKTLSGGPALIIGSAIAKAVHHGGRFIIGDDVRYAQDKATLYVIDADGQECKFQIIRQERLN